MIQPIEIRSRIYFAAVVSLFFLGACSTTLPVPKVPEPAPEMLAVDGGSLPAIDFVNLVTDIPGDRIIGYHYEGPQYTRKHDYRWDENYINETKVLNDYAHVVLAEAGYRDGDGDADALTMVGTIQNLRFNSFDRKVSFDQAECTVRWDIFRSGETVAYYSQMTEGAARVEPRAAGSIRNAFDLALRRLLADAQFVAAVKADD